MNVLKSNYDIRTYNDLRKVVDGESGEIIAVVPNGDNSDAIMQAVAHAILFGGGTLYDVLSRRYTVGTLDVLMREGR